jgi:putative membrane protein
MKQITFLIVALVVCLNIIGCTKNDDKNNTNPLSQADKDFLNKVTYTNLGEVEAGNIAQARGINSAVINYGMMMENDHSAAHDQLKSIAEDYNYSLPGETDQEHKDMAAMLNSLSGDVFDSTYIHKMIEGHDKAITLLQNEISSGQNTAVKAYASEKLPTIQHHRHMADSIANVVLW